MNTYTVKQELEILTPSACQWFPSLWRRRDYLLEVWGEYEKIKSSAQTYNFPSLWTITLRKL